MCGVQSFPLSTEDARVCGVRVSSAVYPGMAQLGRMLAFFLASLGIPTQTSTWLRQLTLPFAGSKGFFLPTSSSAFVVVLVVNFDLEWPSSLSNPVTCFVVGNSWMMDHLHVQVHVHCPLAGVQNSLHPNPTPSSQACSLSTQFMLRRFYTRNSEGAIN